MGLHDQRKQSTDCDSVLPVGCFTTNLVSNKTDRTRLHNSSQWTAINHIPKWVWSKATSKGRNILPTCEQHRNTTQLQAWRTWRTTKNQSNNITHYTDTRRNTMGDTSTRHLDIQQSRVLGGTPQSETQSNVHARPTMSSSNGQAWGLQEDNSTQARWHNRGLRGKVTQPWSQPTKEDAEHSMERWNMVQGQEGCKTTKATNHNIKQSTSSTQSAAGRTVTAEEKIHRKEARETRRDGNKQWAAAK